MAGLFYAESFQIHITQIIGKVTKTLKHILFYTKPKKCVECLNVIEGNEKYFVDKQLRCPGQDSSLAYEVGVEPPILLGFLYCALACVNATEQPPKVGAEVSHDLQSFQILLDLCNSIPMHTIPIG